MIKNSQTKVLTKSPEETKKFAESLGKEAKKTGGVFAIIGDLGAGKTIFAQGFAKGLGIEEKIISPTFVIIRQHSIPNSKKVFYHIDLYRLEGSIDLIGTGLKEILESGSVVLIEWANKIKNKLPQNVTYINISKINGNRLIKIT